MATSNETVNVKINVETAIGEKSIRQMRGDLKDLTAQFEAAQAAGNKPLAAALLKEMGTLRNDIKDTAVYMKQLDPGELLGGFVKFGQGAVGSFAAITGAMTIFGSESETVQKIQQKSMAIIQTMIGLEQFRATFIDGAGKAQLKALYQTTAAQIKSLFVTEATAVAEKGKAVATAAGAVATEGATVAQWNLNAAMMANPIGLLIAGLLAATAAIAYFVIASNSQVAVQKAIDEGLKENAKLMDEYKIQQEAMVGAMQARGEATEFIIDKEFQANKKLMDNNAAVIEVLKRHAYYLTDAQKEELKKREDDNIKFAENDRKLKESQYQLQLKLQKDAERMQIENSLEGRKEEMALLIFDYEEKLRLAGTNVAMTNALIIAEQQAIAKLNKKYAEEDLKLKQDTQNLINKSRISLMDEGLEKEKELLKQSYLENKQSLEAKLKAENLTKDEKAQINQALLNLDKKLSKDTQKLIDDDAKEQYNKRKAAGLKLIQAQKDLFKLIEEIGQNHRNMEMETNELIANDETLSLQERKAAAIKLENEKFEDLKIKNKLTGKLTKEQQDYLEALTKAHKNNLKKIDDDSVKDLISVQDKKLEEIKKWSSAVGNLISGVTDVISQFLSRSFDERINSMNEYYDIEKEKLDESKSNILDNIYSTDAEKTAAQKDYDAKSKELEKKRAAEEKEIKKEAFEQERKAKIIQATISGIVGAIAQFEAGPLGIFLAATVGVLAAAQIALIASEQNPYMARGGMINGPSHRGGGVQVNAEGGEAVVNKNSMAIPAYRNLVSAINVAGGGVPMTGVTASMRQSSSAITASIDEGTIAAIVNQVTNRITSIPVTLVESDVTASQRKIKVIESRTIIG
jgi:hypothetical protein